VALHEAEFVILPVAVGEQLTDPTVRGLAMVFGVPVTARVVSSEATGYTALL
jgi:D-alanine-D-alanine ligase-like ATP-grasp enzyme